VGFAPTFLPVRFIAQKVVLEKVAYFEQTSPNDTCMMPKRNYSIKKYTIFPTPA
jgi:hypothetical protein